jgi:hypothetical protein
MNWPENREIIKKIVGGKKRVDVWDELYRLNSFVAKFPRSRLATDGHAVRKVVGKPRPR